MSTDRKPDLWLPAFALSADPGPNELEAAVNSIIRLTGEDQTQDKAAMEKRYRAMLSKSLAVYKFAEWGSRTLE